jgi:hypothetical protein
MAVSGLGVAGLVFVEAARSIGGRRVVLGLSGASLVGGMALALAWSSSLRFGWDGPTLDRMAAIHGSLNALGFGFLGLVGFLLERPAAARRVVPRDRHDGDDEAEGEGEVVVHAQRPRLDVEGGVEHDVRDPVALGASARHEGVRRCARLHGVDDVVQSRERPALERLALERPARGAAGRAGAGSRPSTARDHLGGAPADAARDRRGADRQSMRSTASRPTVDAVHPGRRPNGTRAQAVDD